MTPNAKANREHVALARLIDQVLRSGPEILRVPDLALATGYSRFHLTRRFREATGESLEEFVRRMRLEKAAYILSNKRSSILQVAQDAGYQSPEAFARAFRASFGVRPMQFRARKDLSWQLPSPTNLHWNTHWTNPKILDIEAKVVECPQRLAAVWRVVGNYAHLSTGWVHFQDRFQNQIPPNGKFITIYLDNMWTHPTMETMRADIGWLVTSAQDIPEGMKRVVIPSGMYAASTRYFERHERNDAWSAMSGRFASGKEGNKMPSYDEYAGCPLPFDQVRTRMFVGLATKPALTLT